MDPEFAPAADSANNFLLDDQVLLDVAPYNGQQLYFPEQLADFVLFRRCLINGSGGSRSDSIGG